MGGVLAVFRWSLGAWWGEMALFAMAGIVSAVIALPFTIVSIIAFDLIQASPVLAVVFVMPFIPNPGWVGLSGIGRRLVQYEGVNWQTYMDTLRAHWRRSTIMFFLSLAGSVITLYGASFYLINENVFFQALGVLMLYILALWMIMQLYLLPLLLEQERGSVFRVYRNALIVAAAKPLLSLGMLFISLVILVAGWFTLIGVPMVVLPFFAVFANCAVRYAVHGMPTQPDDRRR